MGRLKTFHRGSFSLGLLFVLHLSSCKHELPGPVSPIETDPLLLDSVIMLFQDVYLWNDQIDKSIIPPYEENVDHIEPKLRKYIDDVALSAVNPQTSIPYEFDYRNSGSAKYSTFIARGEDTASNGDFGFAIAAVPALNEYRILYVKKGGTAAFEGMTRSDKILGLNGKEILGTNPENTEFIRRALQGESLDIQLLKNSRQSYAVSLKKEKRNISEILKNTILDVGNCKVGYLALRSFPALSRINEELDLIFEDYQDKGVQHLIIDLRYNSGGYVSTSRYLTNLIIPKALEGKKMYHLEYNRQMQEGGQKHLKFFKVLDFLGFPEYKEDGSFLTYADYDYSRESNTYYFEKKGTFNHVKNVYFIVSGQTASASELLINNLRPHISVKLIGERTFGKPIGYFAIDVGKFSLYLSSFLAYNVLGEGTYYQGMDIDKPSVDNITTDFGSIDDPAVQSVISDLNPAIAQRSQGSKAATLKQYSDIDRQYSHKVIGDQMLGGMVNDFMPLKK